MTIIVVTIVMSLVILTAGVTALFGIVKIMNTAAREYSDLLQSWREEDKRERRRKNADRQKQD